MYLYTLHCCMPGEVSGSLADATCPWPPTPTEPALTVDVFDGQAAMEGERGLRRTLALPSWRHLAPLDRLELDLSLACHGTNDSSCPAWDHAVQLFVCCDDPEGRLPPCDPCQPTVWRPGGGGGPGSGAVGQQQEGSGLPLPPGGGGARSLAAAGGAAGSEEAGLVLCGRELGRWMTPFRWALCMLLCMLCILRALGWWVVVGWGVPCRVLCPSRFHA